MLTPSELQAEVRQFRAGETYEPSYDPAEVGWLRVIAPVVSVAADDLENQRERLDQFSLPILPRTAISDEGEDRLATRAVRTSPARTARLFLNQLRSDYRRVAFPNIHLDDIEEQRKSPEWASALKAQGIPNRSVAVLAVGQYLASDQTQDAGLETVLKPWLAAAEDPDNVEGFESTFGTVVGPLVLVAVYQTLAPDQVPGWADQVGEDWGRQFIIAGAQELRRAQQVPDYIEVTY
jgi:hypothetical protein